MGGMIDAKRIASVMGGEASGNRASFPTPGHSGKDRGSWATVDPAAPDGFLVHSQNGGDGLAIKREIMERLGIERAAPSARAHAVKLGAGQRIVATWEWWKGGKLFHRTHRVEPGAKGSKDFAYDHPDGAGGWKPRRGCDPIPYRHDDLAAAPAGSLVFMVEGERKADKLASWGLVATSSRHWRREFAPLIAGCTVVLLPDNDDEGHRLVEDVAAKLPGAAKVLTVELPGLAHKGDIMDWSGTAADLMALVEQAPETPQEAEPAPLVRATPYKWRDPAEIPLRSWVYGRYLLRGTTTAVVAPGGIGKTTLLASTGLALATGRSLLGKTVWGGKQRVWIWNLEDDLDELTRSIQAGAIHFGVTKDEIEGRLFVDSAMEGAELCTATEDEAGFKLLAPIYEAITAELIAREIDVLIIDPFVSSHEVEENANSKIDKIAKAWARVAKAADCSIVLVHHTSKAGAVEVTALSARGAVALVNACRSALVLNRMDPDTAAKFAIDDDKERRRYFSVQDDKHNRAPAENADWYRLASVDLGNGVNEQGDSVGVAEPWSPPDPFDGLTGNHLYRVQLAVSEGSWRADIRAADWVGNAVASALSLDLDVKRDAARIKALLKTWVAEGALKVVERQNEARQLKKFVEVGRWQNDTSATLPQTVASQTVAVEHTGATLQSSPFRGGSVAADAGPSPATVAFPHGNPALKPVDTPGGRDGCILAPGETGDEPIPGWEDFR